MRKQPAFKDLEVFRLSKKLVVACYELTHDLPKEEGNNFARYIRTAALNVHINIAQAAFAKPKKREKFIKAAFSSMIVIDAAAEILVEIGFATQEDIDNITYISSSLQQALKSL